MRTSLIALLLVLLAPMVAGAQSRGGARTRGEGGPPGGRMALPSSGDLQKLSPILILIGKERVLGLTSEQRSQLESLDADLVMGAAPLFKELDSIRADARPPQGGARSMSDEDRARLRTSRQAFGERLQLVRARYDSAEVEALKVLNDEQRSQAITMLEEHKKDLARLVPGGAEAQPGERGPRRGRQPRRSQSLNPGERLI